MNESYLLSEDQLKALHSERELVNGVANRMEELAIKTGRRDFVMAATNSRGVAAIILTAIVDHEGVKIRGNGELPPGLTLMPRDKGEN